MVAVLVLVLFSFTLRGKRRVVGASLVVLFFFAAVFTAGEYRGGAGPPVICHPRDRCRAPRRRGAPAHSPRPDLVAFIAGSLTDRAGRRPLYIGACIVAILFAFPMYLLTKDGSPALVIAVFAVVGLIAILVTKETYGGAERERINSLMAEERAAASFVCG